MGDIVNAMRDYQSAIKKDPSYSLAYYNAANLYFGHRQFQQVLIFFRLHEVFVLSTFIMRNTRQYYLLSLEEIEKTS